ncbi:MAG: hypothetical protein K6A76_03445 [Oribacterium sp.]|nr:hypothetical protein [Oribacterium sp.]
MVCFSGYEFPMIIPPSKSALVTAKELFFFTWGLCYRFTTALAAFNFNACGVLHSSKPVSLTVGLHCVC